MFWFWPRVLMAVCTALGGLALGHSVGQAWSYPLLGSVFGVALAMLVLSALDTWRGGRVLAWLSGSLEDGAPTQVGFWGDAAVRVERALRLRERQARHERERLSQFLDAIEASPNGVLLLDPQEQISWCSHVAAEHLGLNVQRDLRQRITNLVRAPAFVAHLHDRQFDQPVQIPRPHGQGLLLVTVRAYGEGQHLLLTQDITARERAEATRRDFVANVSHEIRTPLTVLAGFVETMIELRLSEVERQRVLTLMTQQTSRMQSLVGDLLTLAKLEGNPRPLLDSWISLEQVGRVIEAEAHPLSGGRHRLEFSWGQGITLAVSEAELQSALSNLVSNAVRYTPDGGSISLSCELRPDGALAVQVRDTGLGISAEHLPRLTERFYRVDGSRSRDTGGTGLGLAIVKHVAQRHGGELVITSELGRGSCFTLLLPAQRVRCRAAGVLQDSPQPG
jgi:two-component system, OmpR family, phosphate regulon sensor histidine kinase PhoR